MVDGMGDSAKTSYACVPYSCVPNHQATADAAQQQFTLRQLIDKAAEQGYTPWLPDTSFRLEKDIHDFLQTAPLHSSHPLWLRSYQWNEIYSIIDNAKKRIDRRNIASLKNTSVQARTEYERVLSEKILIEFPRRLGFSYDSTMETALNAAEALEQRNLQSRELAYIFVIMAREAGLNAFFLGVDRYMNNQTVYEMGMEHFLAGVLLSDGTVLQIDPVYQFMSDEENPGHCEVHFESDQVMVGNYLTSKAIFENRQGRRAIANHLYYRAVVIDPQNATARLENLRDAKFANQTAAIDYWSYLANDFPKDPNIALAVGNFWKDKNPDKALFYYQRAIALRKPLFDTEATIAYLKILNEGLEGKLTIGISPEEIQSQLVNLGFTLLSHEPYNAYDAYLLDVTTRWLYETLQKLEVEEKILAEAKNLQVWHRIPFEQLPAMTEDLMELGHYKEALLLTEEFLILNRLFPQTFYATEATMLEMEIRYGEIPYLMGLKAWAKDNWQNSPHWQQIIEAMIGEIDIQGYPGSAEFSMAVKSAKRLLLMDPNDIEAKQFLALAFAFLPSLNEPYEEYNLELPNNLNNPSNQLYLKVIAIFQTPSGSVQDEKFVELIEWLQELLKDDPQAMETSDESNVRVIYYLEYYYTARQNVKNLKMLLQLREEYQIGIIPPFHLAAKHNERMADLLMQDEAPQARIWAKRLYGGAATLQGFLWPDDSMGFLDENIELNRKKDVDKNDQAFMSQDIITHWINYMTATDHEIIPNHFFQDSYEAGLTVIPTLDISKPIERERALQTFANYLAYLGQSPLKAPDTLFDELGKKTSRILKVLKDRRDFFARAGVTTPMKKEESLAHFTNTIWAAIESGESEFNETFTAIQAAVPAEFWPTLDVFPITPDRVILESDDRYSVVKAALLYFYPYQDPSDRQLAIRILEALANKLNNKDLNRIPYPEDAITDHHPFGPLVPAVQWGIAALSLQDALVLATKIARHAEREDLAQTFTKIAQRPS